MLTLSDLGRGTHTHLQKAVESHPPYSVLAGPTQNAWYRPFELGPRPLVDGIR